MKVKKNLTQMLSLFFLFTFSVTNALAQVEDGSVIDPSNGEIIEVIDSNDISEVVIITEARLVEDLFPTEIAGEIVEILGTRLVIDVFDLNHDTTTYVADFNELGALMNTVSDNSPSQVEKNPTYIEKVRSAKNKISNASDKYEYSKSVLDTIHMFNCRPNLDVLGATIAELGVAIHMADSAYVDLNAAARTTTPSNVPTSLRSLMQLNIDIITNMLDTQIRAEILYERCYFSNLV